MISAITDIRNPTTKEPVSPIKIFHLPLSKLNFKNPDKLPMIVMHNIRPIVFFADKLRNKNAIMAIIPYPPANPSIPSIRLYEFMVTTNMIIDIIIETK